MNRMHPHKSAGIDEQAAYEDASRIAHVGAYQRGMTVGEDITPAGSRSNTKYVDPGAQYTVPTLQKEKMAFKEQLIKSDSTSNSAARWMRGQEDVDHRYAMWQNQQVHDMDRFAASFVDLRDPGNAQWMANIYPAFMERRMKEINRKAEMRAGLEKLKSFGVNSEDDFRLLYNIGAGRIAAATSTEPLSGYKPGFFAAQGRHRARKNMLAAHFGHLSSPQDKDGASLSQDSVYGAMPPIEPWGPPGGAGGATT